MYIYELYVISLFQDKFSFNLYLLLKSYEKDTNEHRKKRKGQFIHNCKLERRNIQKVQEFLLLKVYSKGINRVFSLNKKVRYLSDELPYN